VLQALVFEKIRWKLFGSSKGEKKNRRKEKEIYGAESGVTATTTFSLLNLCIGRKLLCKLLRQW